MSSSYLDRTARPGFCTALGAAVSLAAMAAGPAQAAQTHFQPRVEARVEQNTNRNLATDPADEEDILGYFLDLEGVWSYLTPTSATLVRPRLRFQHYPDNKEIQRSEQFLDLRTRNQLTERSRWDVTGRYSRRDAVNAELGEAQFDDLDPEDPDLDDPADDGDAGLVLTDETRTRIGLRPSFSHQYTELTGFNVRAGYEAVRYDSDSRDDRSEYDYMLLGAEATRRLDPRTVVSVGPYVSRYETRDNSNLTDTYGMAAGWERRWSELHDTRIRLYGERSDIELVQGTSIATESTTNFGGELAGFYRTETGRLRYSFGRYFRPTSAGNRSVTDELRVQYDWRYSERLSFRSAIRALQRQAQGDLSGGDRDDARAELGLTWMATPTVFVGGGYQFTWRDREESTSANNHTVYVSFGYRGLTPRR